jgi:hypothetical protein
VYSSRIGSWSAAGNVNRPTSLPFVSALVNAANDAATMAAEMDLRIPHFGTFFPPIAGERGGCTKPTKGPEVLCGSD